MYIILWLLAMCLLADGAPVPTKSPNDGQYLEYVFAPQSCDVFIREPLAQYKIPNEIDWHQATYGNDYKIKYYLFSKDLSGQNQVYLIVPPISTPYSYFMEAVQEAYLQMIYPMDPYSLIWMMAYFPSENCLYPGQNNCPHSENNRTCTTHVPTPSPTSSTSSPTPSTSYPTPSPASPPTSAPSPTPAPNTSKPTKKPSEKPTISPSAIPSSIPTLSPSPNPTISLILKQGEICIDGYKEAANEAYCEPCGVNEAGTFGSCNECGAGKQPNNNHTQCLLCDDNFIGLDGHCDIDCSQNNKIANELHNECVAMEKETEKEHWYATAEFDAAISGIGVLTGCSCIGAILYAFCKKKLCCAKSKDVTVTDTNNEIKNLNTATNANQRIQIVSK